jgi:hypothetical protein
LLSHAQALPATNSYRWFGKAVSAEMAHAEVDEMLKNKTHSISAISGSFEPQLPTYAINIL